MDLDFRPVVIFWACMALGLIALETLVPGAALLWLLADLLVVNAPAQFAVVAMIVVAVPTVLGLEAARAICAAAADIGAPSSPARREGRRGLGRRAATLVAASASSAKDKRLRKHGAAKGKAQQQGAPPAPPAQPAGATGMAAGK